MEINTVKDKSILNGEEEKFAIMMAILLMMFVTEKAHYITFIVYHHVEHGEYTKEIGIRQKTRQRTTV